MKNQTVRQAKRKACEMMRFFCRATLPLVLALVCAVGINGAYGASPSIGGYNVYYGMLHSHTGISDGDGTPSEAYKYARDNAELDFFSISDHDYWPDDMTSEDWTTIKSAANSYNEDDTFVTFWGFEWTSDSAQYQPNGLAQGHITIINSDDFCISSYEPTRTLNQLVMWLDARDVVAFFNHPDQYGTTFDNYYFNYTDKIVGMELWNKSDDYYETGYYDEALSRGWYIGASGSQDNHSKNWGTRNEWRMAVLATEKTRASILDAMKARRFYSSRDKNLALSFTCNGAQMGSKINEGALDVEIEASDGDSEIFSQIDLLRNGTVIQSWTSDTTDPYESTIVNGDPGDYFYVRVYQSGTAWQAISSPIFIISDELDVTSPTPDPMTWSSAPYGSSTSTISMTADTASDSSGVEYFFECTEGGGHDSGWQDSPTYKDTGLMYDMQFTYRVKARDKSSNHNETGYSDTASGTTQNGPALWTNKSVYAPGEDIVVNFVNASGDAQDWIGLYVDGTIDTSYLTYQYLGTTSGSKTFSALVGKGPYEARLFFNDSYNLESFFDFTVADDSDTTPPTPDSMTFSTAPYATGPYSITMEATVATDSENGVEYYFTCTAGGGHDSGWQDSTSYTDTGLTPETQYTYIVTARDTSYNLNETAPSIAESATTTGEAPGAPVPDVVGMTQTGAETAIVAAGMFVGTVDTEYSDTVASGDVISQYPAGGVSVEPGTSVDLVVSLGDAPPEPENLVLPANGGVMESFTSEYGSGWVASDLMNGVTNEEGWSSDENPGPQEFVFSFLDGNNAILAEAEIHGGTGEGRYYSKDVEVWTSADGANYTIAGSGTLADTDNDTVLLDLGNKVAKKVKLVVTSGYRTDYWELAEFVVNGYIAAPGDPVPDVVGMDQAFAEAAIVAAGFTVGIVTPDYSVTVPAGDVISQVPTGGTGAPGGTSIDLVVSLGVLLVDVPDVVGMAQAAAEAAITAAVLTVGNVTTTYSPIVPAGEVISQSPAAGTSVVHDSAVDLVVSLGIEPVTVPDVVGLARATAEAAIIAATLTVGNVTTAYSDTVALDDVISQDPAGGSSAPAATAIDLIVSLGIQMVSVPNVAGQAQATAEGNIVAAGLDVGTVTTSYSGSVPAGDVISQNPAGGASVAIGSSVDIVVSLGLAPVTVPDVVGLAQATAESDIVAAGLVVGAVTTAPSGAVPAGDIISQNPTGGSSVAAGSSVDLVVSTGASGWTEIDNNNFESGLGIWNDGGSDCRRSSRDSSRAHQGTYCARLRDNTSTSVMSTDDINMSAYSEIKVDFWYYPYSMDNSNEDFWLQISTNGGGSYTTVEEWNKGDEFENNNFYHDSVTITGYTLTGNTRLRFRCDGSGNGDHIYIDEVVISAQ